MRLAHRLGSRGRRIPLTVRQRVRSLYVVQGLQPAQIAKETKLPVNTITQLVIREGWTNERRILSKEVKIRADAEIKGEIDEMVRAVGALSEQGAVAGLQRAVNCTSETHTLASRDFSNWAAGAKSLVTLARQARGLDAKETASAGPAGVNVNLFFMDAPTGAPAKAERKVSPEPAQAAVDVVANAVP